MDAGDRNILVFRYRCILLLYFVIHVSTFQHLHIRLRLSFSSILGVFGITITKRGSCQLASHGLLRQSNTYKYVYQNKTKKKQTKSSMRDCALAICRHHRKTRTKIRVHNIQQEIIVKEIKRLHPPLTSIPHRFRKVYILVFAGSCIAAGSLPNLFEIILSLLWCTPGFSFIHV